MASSRKKVLVRRFSGAVTPGYLPSAEFWRHGQIDLLDLDGRVIPIEIKDIKMISFVRDFNLGDRTNPERLVRKTFPGRPRTDGLWVRLTFRDGDLLEGMAATDITFLDSIQTDAGVQIAPPDTRSNTQRIYVPRTAVTAVELVAVINAQARRKVPEPMSPTQEELFHGDLPPNTRPN
jgi:hypothetical protein